MLLISLYDPDTHLDTAISKMLAEKWQDMDRIIDQFLLLPRVMYGYLEIIILLQGRLAIDHRILKIHFLVNRCGVIIPFTNQGIIVKGSYYLLYVRCRLLNGLLLSFSTPISFMEIPIGRAVLRTGLGAVDGGGAGTELGMCVLITCGAPAAAVTEGA